MKKQLVLLLLVIVTSVDSYALSVYGLKVNSIENPQCIDDDSLLFSWKLSSSEKDVVQTAFKISLFSDSEKRNVIYESDFTSSSQAIDVKLNNLQLHPATRYYWNVTVCDNHGNIATSEEFSYFDTGLMETGWNGAKWIRGEKGEGVPHFRKSFVISKPIRNAKLFCSALGIYEVYINGSKCFSYNKYGEKEFGILKPGNTVYEKRVFYNCFDITMLIAENKENVLGAIVATGWWNGRIAQSKYHDKENAFICKCIINYTDGSSEIIISDLSWQYSKKMALRSSDIYDGEVYDARLEDDWGKSDYDTRIWNDVVECKDFTGIIDSYIGPMVREVKELALKPQKLTLYNGNKETGSDFGIINITSEATQVSKFVIKKGETAIIDFGQNHSGWINFVVKGESGTKLQLRFSEMLNDDGALSRFNDGPGGSLYLANLRTAKAEIQYVCAGKLEGESYCPIASYYGYRYCSITPSEQVEIDSIISYPITSSPILKSNIETDNRMVNQLFSNIQWGQRSNYVSIPTDCPQRDERIGWLADTQLFSRTGMYNDDTRSFFRKWMQDLRDSQQEDGSIPSTAPLVYYHSNAAGWSDACVVVPWNVYLMYGDTTIIEDNYETMTRYMDCISTLHDGNIQFAGANTNFGDWLALEPTDKRFVSMAYYAYDAQLMSKMTKIMMAKHPQYLKKDNYYDSLYIKIRDEIQNHFFEDGLPNELTQTTLVLALAFNLYTDSFQKNKLVSRLEKKIYEDNETLTTGFIGTSLLNTTLSQFGLSEKAYNLLLQRNYPSWLYSVDQGATTIWERWNSYTRENGFGYEGMNSFNHYAYGAVGEWMYRYVLGIEVNENTPGFKHFILQPHPDLRETVPQGQLRLNKVSGSYESQYGKISLSWEIGVDNKINYSATVPVNTQATLKLPQGQSDIEAINYLGGIDGLVYKGTIDNFEVYALQSGSYSFKTTLSSEVNNHIKPNVFGDNPYYISNNAIYFNGKNSSVRLYDIMGNGLLETMQPSRIDLRQYPKGILLLIIHDGENIRAFKIANI